MVRAKNKTNLLSSKKQFIIIVIIIIIIFCVNIFTLFYVEACYNW